MQDLKSGGHDFPLLTASGLAKTEEQKDLLSGKGFFPYGAFKSFEAFKQQKWLSPREDFYNDLTGCHLSEEDYAKAQKIYNALGCKDMSQMALIYCKSDTTLLLESLLQFSKTIQDNFNLDVAQYISLPQLAQDAIFSTSGCEVDLISDMDMFEEIESNLRGGFAFVKNRYQEAGPDQQLLYLDANVSASTPFFFLVSALPFFFYRTSTGAPWR